MSDVIEKTIGRPKKSFQTDIRQRLFDAAKELFGQNGYESVSTRQIAQAANTTPAMIRYYFANKQGLYFCILTESGGQIKAMLQEFNRAPKLEHLEQFFLGFYDFFYLNNTHTTTLLRHNISNSGDIELMKKVIDTAPKPAYKLLVSIIEKLQSSQQIRADIDSNLLAVQIMSLCSYPCIFNPMFEQIMERTLDKEFYTQLAQQNLKVLLTSILPEQ